MDGFLGEIRLFAADFAPNGWALCQGQLLPINQNQALFSVLGTTYGGNGTTNFALPDFRGRAPLGYGTSYMHDIFTDYAPGQKKGSLTKTLTTPHLPAHTHPVTCTIKGTSSYSGTTWINGSSLTGDKESPKGNYFAVDGTARFDNEDDGVTMSYTIPLGNTGGNNPISNLMPYLAIQYIICIQGSYYAKP
jgi:microcystin-dependent protein